jgi:hypothetical protein
VVRLAGVVVVGFSVEARRGGDSVVGLAGVVVVGFSVDFRLGLGFCRLGFLGFAGWVSMHSVVVVDGLGLGLGSRRGGGAVPDLGFFFLFNSLVLKLWNLTIWLWRN